MPHDVFVSYSSADRSTAEAVCAALEAAGLSCWIAPRDAAPGAKYQGSIVRAIRDCRVMVLIFSARSNESEHVFREVHTASKEHRTIVPFRVERITPNDDYSYYISTLHWLDAFPPPLEPHLERLVDAVLPLVRGAGVARAHAEALPAAPARRRVRPSAAVWGLTAATVVVAGFGVLNVSRLAQSAGAPEAGTVETESPGAATAPAAHDVSAAPAAELSSAEPATRGHDAPATPPPPTGASRSVAAPAEARAAPEVPLSARRVLVLVRAQDHTLADAAESVLLRELAGADYDVVDANRAAALRDDAAVASGQAGGIARVARGVAAGTVLLVDVSADARPAVPGMFTGTAALTLRAYAAPDARLVRTERVDIGTSRSPGELGATPAAAATAAVRAAAYQAARATLPHLQ